MPLRPWIWSTYRPAAATAWGIARGREATCGCQRVTSLIQVVIGPLSYVAASPAAGWSRAVRHHVYPTPGQAGPGVHGPINLLDIESPGMNTRS